MFSLIKTIHLRQSSPNLRAAKERRGLEKTDLLHLSLWVCFLFLLSVARSLALITIPTNQLVSNPAVLCPKINVLKEKPFDLFCVFLSFGRKTELHTIAGFGLFIKTKEKPLIS